LLLGSQEYRKNAARQALLQSCEPDFNTLRLYIFTNDVNTFDRLKCEQLMYDETIDDDEVLRFHAITIVDSLRDIPRQTSEQRFINIDTYNSKKKQAFTYVTMKYMHHNVMNGYYFTQMCSNNSHPLQYLLTKVMNQRCQTRLYENVALRKMKEDPTLITTLQEIVCVSLLGNYAHVKPSTRPSIPVRYRLYQIFIDQAVRYRDWFLLVVTHCNHLLLYTLRQYVCFAVHDAPGFYEHIEQLTQISALQTITLDACKILREYFNTHLCEPTSSLYASLEAVHTMSVMEYNTLDRSHYVFRWMYELQQLLTTHKKAVTEINYRRAPDDLSKFVIGCRNKFPLVMLPNQRLKGEQKLMQDVEEKKLAFIASYMGASKQRQQQLQLEFDEENEDNDDAKRVLNIDWYVTKQQCQLLNQLMQTHSVDNVIALFPRLGCSIYATNILISFREIFKIGILSQDKIKSYLGRIRSQFPHAYNLLQLSSEIARDQRSLKHIAELPLHYTLNQLTAIQHRFQSNNTLIKSALTMVYCDICGTDYSLRRQFKSNYKQRYAVGLRDVLVQYTTNEMFCKNNKSNHRGRCGELPLKQVNLLGQCIEFNNKTLILCPQPKCGMPMVIERSDLQRKAIESKKQQTRVMKRNREYIVTHTTLLPQTPIPITPLITSFKKAIEIPKKRKKRKRILSFEYKQPFLERIQQLDLYKKKLQIWDIAFQELKIPELTEDAAHSDEQKAYVQMTQIIRDILEHSRIQKRMKTRCMYNEYGIACCDCTMKHEQQTGLVEELYRKYDHLIDKPNLTCALCTLTFISTKQMYLYPCDILLCSRHNTKGARALTKELEIQYGDTLTKAILLPKLHELKKDNSRSAPNRNNTKQAKAQLQRTKARNRQGNRR
jgi:hypothetical protein